MSRLNYTYPKLHLPPESTPLVAVLVNVPHLYEGKVENYDQLRSKILHWLRDYCDHHLMNVVNRGIIMARRIAWVGNGRKEFEGDCIVINFNCKGIVPILLKTVVDTSHFHSGISLFPLGFFYRPHHTLGSCSLIPKPPLVTNSQTATPTRANLCSIDPNRPFDISYTNRLALPDALDQID